MRKGKDPGGRNGHEHWRGKTRKKAPAAVSLLSDFAGAGSFDRLAPGGLATADSISPAFLLIVYAMYFLFVFERKRPQARELVVLAVLLRNRCGVVGAPLFGANFKPMAAIIMIAGMAFGAEAGFWWAQ